MQPSLEALDEPSPGHLPLFDSLEEREQRYRELTEFLPQTIFEMDQDGTITFANQAFFAAFRYDSDDFKQGLNILDLHIPEERELVKTSISGVLTGGRTGNEYVGLRKDGTTFPIMAQASRILCKGKPVGLRGIIVDLTEQKRAEAVLRASKERYRAVFENTGNAAILVEEDTSISLANSEWFRLSGCSPELGPVSWRDFVHPEDIDRLESYRAARYQGDPEVPWEYEYRLINRSGELRHVINHVSLIPETKTCFCSLMDITDRKKVECERQELQERLRQSEKMEAIGQLAGGVAHDFNNHLGAIMGFAELIGDEAQDERVRHFAQNITKSCQRAADLTKQLLAFARKGKYLAVPVNMHQIIHDVIGLFEHSIDRRITLEHHLEAERCSILGDPGQIQSALMNLALNARDAMPEGGKLSFSTRAVFLDEDYCRRMPYAMSPGRYLRINVEDTGMGMDSVTKKRIFEPFFTTKEVGKGTGLGLASVYGTVKHHHGAIHVYSELGRGSCFKLYLPLHEEEVWLTESQFTVVPAQSTSRILLVDDEELVAEMATEMLQSLGYEVVVCRNGREAVEVFQSSWQDFQLVILDMVMPQLGGKDTFRALRSIHPGANIILSSGFSVEGEAQELLNAGAFSFLQKPYQKSELAQAVEEALKA